MRLIPPAIALIIVTLTAVVHGVLTDRWTASAKGTDLQNVDVRIPMTVGDWLGESVAADAKLVSPQTRQLAIRYTNIRTGSLITMMLVWGRSGPVSVHTPDVCYTGAGYELVSPITRYSVLCDAFDAPATFCVGDFCKQTADAGAPVRVLWAWNATDSWIVPENPRFAFARQPLLYKLYVVRQMLMANEPLDGDPCVEFLRLLLPQLGEPIVASHAGPRTSI